MRGAEHFYQPFVPVVGAPIMPLGSRARRPPSDSNFKRSYNGGENYQSIGTGL